MNRSPLDRSPFCTLIVALFLFAAPTGSLGQDLQVCAELGVRTSNHPQVFAGKDGWVFSAADLRDRFLFEPTLPFLERLSQALARQDTQLVMLLVPTRGMVHQDRFPDRLPDNLTSSSMTNAQAQYQEFRKALEDMDIITPDILAAALAFPGAEEAFFFKLDHHWTPSGARVTAQAAAEAIQTASPRYEQLEKIAYETNRTDAPLNRGSYWRVINEVCEIELEDEPVDQFRTTLAQGTATNLFTDLQTEVVLVGTSFSSRVQRQRDFNLAGFLSQFLSLNVASEAVGAAGPFGALEAYLLDEARQAPSYLIWELPLRNFPPVDGFRQLAPAVDGPCDPEHALSMTTFTLGTSSIPNLGGTEVELPPDGGYIFIEFEDTSILNFSVSIDIDSRSGIYPISRSSRVPNPGQFYLDLSDRGGGIIQDLDLFHLPEQAQGDMDLRICPSL